MNKETATIIIISLAVAWFIQYGLSFWQLRRFYKGIYKLRRLGSVWIGLEGSAWKGRQYAILVVSKEKIITHVEEFSGWTILAKMKPVAGFEGHPISDLLDDSIQWPVSKKMLLALRNAVKHIRAAEEKKAKEAIPQEEIAADDAPMENTAV